MRFVIDRSQPAYVPGFTLRYYVPFVGDKWLWETRGSQSTFNPPSARVSGAEIILEYTLPGSDIAKTKGYYDNAIATIQQWIGFQKGQIDTFNSQLRGKALALLGTRRSRLQTAADQVGAIGFPSRRKEELRPLPSAQPAAPAARSRPPAHKYDVALSFAGEDRVYVEKVAARLKEMNINLFYDKFEETKLWGTNLLDYLSEVYGRQSRFVVMFISRHYAAKAWPNVERQSAQARAIQEKHIVVLPVRFDDTELPGLPVTVAYLDLRQKSPDDLVNAIVEKLKGNA